MTVLFTHSYFYKFDEKQWRFKQPYPPLATILAASVMRQAGYTVALFDTNLRDDPMEITPVLESFRPKYLVIYDDGFNYLSKMCLTKMREAAFKMAEESKKFGCTVIVSSSDAADHYEKYFKHNVDFVVRGEGEETLTELLNALENGREVSSIAGLAFPSDGKVRITSSRPVIKNLDQLPLPAWDLVDIDSYKNIWMDSHGYFALNIATTRGCPFKCNWCAKPIYGNRYTSRSPNGVVDEIEFLIKKYEPNYFWMCDDIFGLKPGWVQEFRTQLKQRNIQIRYKIQSRVDLLLQEDTLDALAESGADTVWVGAESGSQKILDAMDKGTRVEEIHQATRLMKEKGIKVAFFLQFGYLGETEQDIKATIEMVRTLMPDEVGISVSYPLPGTKFYEKVKDQMREKQNWTDSDDLMVMFESTFNKRYYKELHRYVHAVYRREKGFLTLKKLFNNPFRFSYQELRTGLATFYYIPTTFTRGLKLKKLKSESPAVNL